MTSEYIKNVARQLKDVGVCPVHMQLTSLGEGVVLCNAFDKTPESPLEYGVCCGMSDEPNESVIKALSEYVERSVMKDYEVKQRKEVVKEFGTDGLAAYPLSGKDLDEAKAIARRNAFKEATERFVWAKWWDNREVGHFLYDMDEVLDGESSESCDRIWSLIKRSADIQFSHLVSPCFDVDRSSEASELEVILIVLRLNPCGVLTGGACGARDERSSTIFRALSELYRHIIGFQRLKDFWGGKLSLYEERVRFFGEGHGDELVTSRLRGSGREKVFLNGLSLDEAVEHPFSHLYSVHRCLFDDQPKFIGGDVNRLCF